MIDAEGEYEGKYVSAQTYIQGLRHLIGSRFPVALAGLPYVDYHPAFPYSVFLGPGGAKYNAPQMYWTDIGTSVDRVYAPHVRVQPDLRPDDLPARRHHQRRRPPRRSCASASSRRCTRPEHQLVGLAGGERRRLRAISTPLIRPASQRDGAAACIARHAAPRATSSSGRRSTWTGAGAQLIDRRRLRPGDESGGAPRSSARRAEPRREIDEATWHLLLRHVRRWS